MKYHEFEKRLLEFSSYTKQKLTDVSIASAFQIPINEVKQHMSSLVKEGIVNSIVENDYLEYKLLGRDSLRGGASAIASKPFAKNGFKFAFNVNSISYLIMAFLIVIGMILIFVFVHHSLSTNVVPGMPNAIRVIKYTP